MVASQTDNRLQPIPGGAAAPVLEIRGLHKSYGAVQAVRDLSMSIHAGEVLGLLGDNGAGKSTVVRCVSGAERVDEGSILMDGVVAELHSPQDARRLGVETVYQDLALFQRLDTTANLFLNREILRRGPLRWIGWLDREAMENETRSVLDRLAIRLPSVRLSLEDLSGGQRQAVAVGRAVAWGKHLVILDEPTAALGVQQSALILGLIRKLREAGMAVMLVSHNMHDVLEVCDRVVVLRHGAKAAQLDRLSGITARDLVNLITGVGLSDAAGTPR